MSGNVARFIKAALEMAHKLIKEIRYGFTPHGYIDYCSFVLKRMSRDEDKRRA